jgi:hypothetical protein
MSNKGDEPGRTWCRGHLSHARSRFKSVKGVKIQGSQDARESRESRFKGVRRISKRVGSIVCTGFIFSPCLVSLNHLPRTFLSSDAKNLGDE